MANTIRHTQRLKIAAPMHPKEPGQSFQSFTKPAETGLFNVYLHGIIQMFFVADGRIETFFLPQRAGSPFNLIYLVGRVPFNRL